MYDQFFSERMAQLRIKKGLSAHEMSISIGRGRNYINTIENKKSLPSMTEFFYICEFLKITPQDFFTADSDNPIKLNEIIANLKLLDENDLTRIGEVIESLAHKSV